MMSIVEECSVNNSGYSPSSIVNVFHDIPHVNIDLDSSPSQFETSLDYFQAIIIWGAVPVLTCVCLFILMIVYCVCVCCCCKEKKSRPKAFNCGCAFLVSLVILFCLALIGAGIYAEFTFNKNVLTFISDGSNIVDDLNNVTSELNSFNFIQVNSSLDIVINGITFKDDAIELRDGLNNINNGFTAVLNNVNNFDYTIINDIDYYEEIRHWLLVGYFILIAFILLIVFVVSMCLSATGTIIMIIIVGVVTLTVWVVCGGSLSFVIIMADGCYNPDGVIRYTFNDTSTKATIDYYIVCEEECSPFSETDKIIVESFKLIEMVEEAIKNNITNTDPDVQANFTIVSNGIISANSIYRNVEAKLKCIKSDGIHEYYRRSLDSACGDGFQYGLILFCLFVALAITLIVLLCCMSCFGGLLVSTIKDDLDDDFVAYDAPRTATWSQRRSSYTEPYSNGSGSNNAFTTNEEYRLTGLSRNATIEPPKYMDVGRPMSGEYDHFDT